MKFYTTDKTVLMEVTAVTKHKEGIVLDGNIMGTMPLKAVIRPSELRAGMRFLSAKLIWALLKMLVTGKA
jgi:hypothetical protein